MVFEQSEKPVASVNEKTPMSKVVNMMEEYNVGSIVVTKVDKPVGVITDRDVALKFGRVHKDSSMVEAQSVMQTPITTIRSGSGLMQIVQTMASADVRRLPVVDDKDKLVDIVTMDDIVVLLAETLGGLEDIIKSESPENISDFVRK